MLRVASQLIRCRGRNPTVSIVHHSAIRYAAHYSSSSSVSAAELQFGQPLHETHPHLLKPGELTPGITALEYARRRSKLAASLPEGSIAILAAAEVKYRSKDVFYDFHQDSNFFYLTGFDEPEALAIIAKSSTPDDHIFHLYVRPKDPKAEKWEGTRSGTQAAVDVFNADETGPTSSLPTLLPPILSSHSKIYTDIPSHPTPPTTFLSRLSTPRTPHISPLLSSHHTIPLSPLLHPLRSLKSPSELHLLRSAGRSTGRALTSTMSVPHTSESALSSYLSHSLALNGTPQHAYIPVIAGDSRGSTIHYTANNALLAPESRILVDAGAEVSGGGYVTDITRVWPNHGTFTREFRALYEVVLGAQRHAISLCRGDANVSLDELHSITVNGIADGLRAISTAGDQFPTDARSLDVLFPHHVGHYIGLDVHDTPTLSRRERLREGMCVTVEPGVYVPDDERWPRRWRGMGVRVEDSVAVGDTGPIVLSVEAVKEVDDIEALRG